MRSIHTPRASALTAIALTGALALTACGGSEAAAPSGSADVAAGDFSGETLTYWSFWQEKEPQAQAIAAAIDDFEEATGATVEVEWQGRQMTQKLAPAMRSNAPDVVEAALDNLAPIVGDGQGEDLSSVFGATSINEQTPLSDTGVGKYKDLVTNDDGAAWLVPYSVLGMGIWYDAAEHKDLADNAPKSLDDLAALIKQEGKGSVALDGDVGFYTTLWVESILMRELGPEKFRSIVEDKTGEAWKADDVVAALEKVTKVVPPEAFAAGSFGSKFPAIQEGWASGKSAFLLNGSWIPQETATSVGKDFTFASLEIPVGSTGEANTQIGLTGYAVPAKAENKDLAKAFIRFVLEKKYQEDYVKKASALSTRDDVSVPADLEALADSIAQSEPVLVMDGVNVDYAGIVPEVFAAPVRNFLSGNTDAKGFANEISATQANYWKGQG
ncbi:ABC transporter substrate-binding protein [Paeniglutamicibacter sp. MACA_103]|uniref:ABC transporter substrate-binding protein n=1 Tax=Paeniglutamicibacter sp. MACA_103 TaxID=3377337 RepID=UPI003894A2CD